MPPGPLPSSLTIKQPTPAFGHSDPTAVAQFVPGQTTNKDTFLSEFWRHIIGYAERYTADFKDSHIPPARIKKLVKADPDVKMIANEATVLLNKACEIFVNEVTVRAFLVATAHNRRTVNASDITFAISQSDMFDFLIDIVPAEHPPPNNPNSPTPLCTTPMPSTSTKKRSRAPSALPTGNSKKKAPVNKSPSVDPVELAVLLHDRGSPAGPSSRLLAVPIPDSELIPPSRGPWELAVPISRDSVDPMLGCEEVKQQDPPDWELAVPILSPQRPGSGPCATVENAHRPSRPVSRACRANKSWDMAVPIIEQDEPVEQGLGRLPDAAQRLESWEMAMPISPREMAVPISSSRPAAPPGRSSWELAVPITASSSVHPNAISPSASPTQSLANLNNLAQIDPLLYSLKAEPSSEDEDGLPHNAQLDVIIKNEE